MLLHYLKMLNGGGVEVKCHLNLNLFTVCVRGRNETGCLCTSFTNKEKSVTTKTTPLKPQQRSNAHTNTHAVNTQTTQEYVGREMSSS